MKQTTSCQRITRGAGSFSIYLSGNFDDIRIKVSFDNNPQYF